MVNSKELKKKARKNVKEHIIIFVIICAIASFIGAEFVGTLYFTTANNNYTLDNIISSIMEKGVDETKREIEDNILNYQHQETKMMGRSNGVFAFAINAVASGSFYMVLFSALKNIFNSPTIILTIITFGSLCLYFIYWYYIINTYNIITRRFFLEGRTYKKIPFRRLIFLKKTKTWSKVSFVIFIKKIYQSLWDLTIIGGFIKHYSYLMVPYILAENPTIKAKDCITLSRKMMYGHKWEAFKISLSFIIWDILSTITLGISGLIFSNSYKIATFSELYVELRKQAKENKILNSELLNDKYLYEKADKEILEVEYEDAIKIINQENYNIEKKKRI